MQSDARDVMVIQQGARRNYIYARLLNEAGLLHSLMTDAAWAKENTLTKCARRLRPSLSGAIERRLVQGIPASRLRSSPLPNAMGVAHRFMSPERVFHLADEALAVTARMRGIAGVKTIVNYQGNGGSFLAYAKSKDVRIVTDFVITPRYLEVEREERKRFPDWEPVEKDGSVYEFYRSRVQKIVQLSDVYLCPSVSVARDLSDLDGFDPSKVRVVEYGASDVAVAESQQVVGRVLFVGAAGLRKGIPYLARAAELLKQAGAEIEIVVAGHVSDRVKNRPEVRYLTFLGPLSRSGVAQEYAKADVFCLPTLAEGSPTSIFEALAYGLPVITTRASGSAIQHGADGYVVEERNADAIAEAVLAIVNNRDLRERLSHRAKKTAATYSDAACGKRFVEVVRSVSPSAKLASRS